jgi:hypothetical protein
MLGMLLLILGSTANALTIKQTTRISWQPPTIEKTIGNGSGATRDETFTFVSNNKLTNVVIWVTPELRPFLRVEPEKFDNIQAGVPYNVKAHFVIPPRALEGIREGTVHLRLGNATLPNTLKVKVNVDYAGNVIPNTTHVLPETTTRYLTLVTPERLVFSQITPDLTLLSPGSVIASGVTSTTPHGFLREVASIETVGNGIVVHTLPAALADAIQHGSIHLSEHLIPSDALSGLALQGGALRVPTRALANALSQEGFYVAMNDVILYDEDGDRTTTTNDQIRANGSVSVDPLFDFDIDLDGFQLKSVRYFVNTTQQAEIELTALIRAASDFKIEVSRYHLPPITVYAGFLPVVIEPVLTLNVGLDGEVSAGVTAGVTEQAVVEGGLAYENGSWIPLGQDPSVTLDYSPPTVTAGFDAKAYAGPQLSLLIYGAVGPYADPKAYLELNTDVFGTPWWELYGGLELGIGIRFEILAREIVDYYDPAVVGYRRLLAQATSPPPILGGFISGSVKDAVTRLPLSGVTVQASAPLLPGSTAITDANGSYRMEIVGGTIYTVEFSRAGYLPALYSAVSVDLGATTFLEAVLQVDQNHAGPGDIAGRALNALTGIGIGNLQIVLRSGINVTSGAITATTLTSNDGSYGFNDVPAGQYTGQVSGAGYTSSFFTVLSIGGTLTGNQNVAVTPVLSAGETRIVLTWGATPSDLDSHLTGPLPDGSRFHMYYPYSGNYSPWPEFVTLDLDDVTSYGPETTTILQQNEGVYRFSVHDYSNGGSTSSTALTNSGAQVRVYRGSNLIATFNVPSNQAGTLWTVFELNGNTITPVNSLTFLSSSSTIQRFSVMALDSGADNWSLADLPPKGN